MKQQEHLWQNQSPNFLAEKAFNAAVAALEPHCAICSLFHPYEQVIGTFYKVTAQNQRSHGSDLDPEGWEYSLRQTRSVWCPGQADTMYLFSVLYKLLI